MQENLLRIETGLAEFRANYEINYENDPMQRISRLMQASGAETLAQYLDSLPENDPSSPALRPLSSDLEALTVVAAVTSDASVAAQTPASSLVSPGGTTGDTAFASASTAASTSAATLLSGTEVGAKQDPLGPAQSAAGSAAAADTGSSGIPGGTSLKLWKRDELPDYFSPYTYAQEPRRSKGWRLHNPPCLRLNVYPALGAGEGVRCALMSQCFLNFVSPSRACLSFARPQVCLDGLSGARVLLGVLEIDIPVAQ